MSERRYTGFDFAHDRLGHGCYAIDLDEHVQSFDPTIRDQLVAQGVLHLDTAGVWRLAWHGFDLEAHKASWLAICDFCNARPVTWNVPCEVFDLPGFVIDNKRAPTMTSTGDWAACDTCGQLVADRKKEQFLAHCLQRRDSRVQRQLQKALHRRFWRHYAGGAVRITPHLYGH